MLGKILVSGVALGGIAIVADQTVKTAYKVERKVKRQVRKLKHHKHHKHHRNIETEHIDINIEDVGYF